MTIAERLLLVFGIVFFVLAFALIGAMVLDLTTHPTALHTV